MSKNIVVQYIIGQSTVLNGAAAIRLKDASGNSIYFVPEDSNDRAEDANIIGYIKRSEDEYLNNRVRFAKSNTFRTPRLYNISSIEKIRTEHRDGGFVYWKRYREEE